MEYRILGALEVSRNGSGPIPLGGAKQRAVLAHLLLRANHLVPTEVLIDEVWGDEPPETARNALQSYASHLRKALGAERLEGSRAGYLLRAEPTEVDATRFQALLRDARRVLPIDARAAVATFDHALAIWRGPALADLATEPALQAEAARLDDLRLGALEDRVDAQLTIGQHGDVIGELENLTIRHPLRERFWEQLMLALYRSGRQGEALGAYQRARGILADELGVDPSPELRRLHERILAQSPDLDLGGEPLRGYRLLERIGENALGALYRATQPIGEREVAVRMVHEHRANDPAFVRGFENRAQAIASLEHPHVAPIYDYWREPGRAYIVTRFLRGGSLGQMLDHPEPLDHERATRILEQVASALTAAHRRGVGHGDLRPSNVLFDEEGNAYVTDFLMGDGMKPGADDLHAFAVLARETMGGRLPMTVGELLRCADTSDRAGDGASLFAEIASSFGSMRTATRTHPAGVRNPYKGLRPFLEADAGDFFGREEFVARLIERMGQGGDGPRFIAVVGPSGSGKSSVVRAGLVSAIHAGTIAGSQEWLVTEMHPGHHPFEELDAALMSVAVDPPVGLLARLESGPRGLVEVANAIAPPGADLVLIVDQFEEIFTLTESEEERALLLESLRVAALDPASRVRVVATLRADFYDRPLRYPRMGPLLGSTTEALSPLTPEELERAVVRPAEHSGLAVESALVPQIATDVAEQPGALPLVQYALTELFDRRDDGHLTLDAYHEIGGVGGALAASAEHLYATRHPVGREAVRQLFLRLVTLGEGAADTRRRVPLSELSAIEVDRSAMEAAIDAYGRHRLLTFDRDPATREPTVEIAHEALLEAWGKLRGWIDEARDDVRLRRRLSEAAREWEISEEEPGFLLAGSRLDQFETWGEGTSLALGTGERRFLTASVARRDEERAAEATRHDRERLLERRSVKRLRALVAVLTAGVVLAGTLTAIVVDRNAEAQRASELATARELVSAATANLERDRELALMLALEATGTLVDGAILPEAEEILRRAAPALSIDTTAVIGTGTLWPHFPPNGRAVAILDGDGSVGVWDLATGARTLALRSSGRPCGNTFGSLVGGVSIGCPNVFRVDLSDDASRVALADGEGRARVWDLGSGSETLNVAAEVGPSPTSAPSGFVAPRVALSPDGRFLATSGTLGTVRLWDIETGQMMWSLATRPKGQGLRHLASSPAPLLFSLDGTRLFVDLAFAREPGAVGIVDVNGGRMSTSPVERFWHYGNIDHREVRDAYFTFGPDGAVLASFEGNRVWLVRREEFADEELPVARSCGGVAGCAPIHVLKGHTRPIRAAAFSEDGGQLATGGLDGTVRVWNTSSGDLVFTSPAEESDVVGVVFGPEESRVTAIYSDGRIIVHAISLDDVIEIARGRVTRGFTNEECHTYLHVPTCASD